jgi:hypothetical protein
MASGITVDVRITRDYLRSFIYNEYNLGDEGTINLSADTDIGKLIKSLLVKTPLAYSSPGKRDDVIMFALPYWNDINVMVYNYLTPSGQTAVENYVSDLLTMKTRMYLMDVYNAKLELKNNIYLFMELNGIPITDTNYERIKKDFDRWRCRQKHKNLHSALTIMASVIF